MRDPDKLTEIDRFCIFAYCTIAGISVVLILIDAILL